MYGTKGTGAAYGVPEELFLKAMLYAKSSAPVFSHQY